MTTNSRNGGAGASASARARELRAAGRRTRLVLRGGLALVAAVAGWWLAGWRVALVLAVVVAVADTVRAARTWSDAAAWRKGGIGERRTGRMLRPLERAGYTVLHDRSMPGSSANLDHLVIGPAGVVVVDTKNWGKDTRITGGLAGLGGTRRGRVRINGRPAVERLRGILHGQRLVGKVLSREVGRPIQVTPLVAVHGARRMRWGSLQVEGVTLLYARRARRWIRHLPAQYGPEDVARLAEVCRDVFPPYAG